MKHDIEDAAYVGCPGGYKPTLVCSCGYHAKGYTWEEAGGDYDAHLSSAQEEEGK
jgi:hypothetical protein